MKNAMAVCADAINDVERKIVEALKSTNDPATRWRLAEALSFISEAREAIAAAKTKVDSIPPPALRNIVKEVENGAASETEKRRTY